MLDFRLLPMFDDTEKFFRYDPRGRGGLLLSPLITFTVSITFGMIYNVLLQREARSPAFYTVIVALSILSVLAVLCLKFWSVRQMEPKFHNWLKEKHGLIASEDFKLGDRGRRAFSSAETGEQVNVEIFSFPVYLEKSFLGIPYSIKYTNVEFERVPAAPTFKV